MGRRRAIGGTGELFTYPGESQLFPDRDLPDYDAKAAGEAMPRILTFLQQIDAA